MQPPPSAEGELRLAILPAGAAAPPPSPLVMRLVAQLASVVLVACVTAVLFFLGGWA